MPHHVNAGDRPLAPESLARLPSLIAIPLGEYAAETHPVLGLHRLCDAVELLTRFCVVALLGEHRARSGDDSLPPKLVTILRESVQRPTFGSWAAMLRELVTRMSRGDPLVLSDLPNFVTAHLLPTLPSADKSTAYTSLLALRNDLAHGGGTTRAAAEEFLRHWEPRLRPLWQGLAFLEGADVCLYDGRAARRLVGPTHAVGEECVLSADLRKALDDRGLADHVVLLRGDRWLDLWPLCDYGRATAHTPQGARPAKSDSPMVFYRSSRERRLTYVALGSDRPFADGSEAAAVTFRRLFQLDCPIPRQAVNFEEEMRADAAALVGRMAELDGAVALLKDARTRVFWVGGRGGIGKSFLMAKLCCAPTFRGDTRKVLVVAWRFKASDQTRGNRTAFFRHAVSAVAEWLGEADVTPSADPGELYTQLMRLLDAAAARRTADQRGRPPRVLFFLDGLDEIDRLDPTFADVPFLLSRPNVVWVCSGRPEGRLPEVFRADRCTPVFGEDGLPPMSDADIRGMMVDATGALKYDLLREDREQDGGGKPVVVNDVVRAVTERAGGLPLYVHFVIEDVLSGHFRFADLPQRLPPSLSAYFDDLLRRLSIGALQALLTPLVVTIAWAKAPLDEETLFWLLLEDGVLFADDEECRGLLRDGLAAVQSMVRLSPVPGGGLGYEPYHDTFRAHILRDENRRIGQENPKARRRFERLAREWAKPPAKHPARLYALRYGRQTLLDNGRSDDAAALLLDLPFLEAKAEAGMVFELVEDFTEVVAALKPEHPGREQLRLLEEAIRQDIHFIARHPTTLFQCLWNSCWWYDCPEAARHYEDAGEAPPWARPGPKLSALLEGWRAAKEAARPGFVWLRSLRPPAVPLGGGQVAILRGHERAVRSVSWSPDGRRLASGAEDRTLRVWDTASGQQLHCLRGHQRGEPGAAKASWTDVSWSPDGRRLASGGRDNTVRVWDAASGQQLHCLRGHEGGVYSVSWSPDGRRLASGGHDGGVRVWDAASGQQLACLRGHTVLVRTVNWSPDGLHIASGAYDNTVRVWDVASAQELYRLQGHEGGVESVGWSPDGRRFASGAGDRTLRVWDAASGRQLHCLRGHQRGVTSVGWSPDGRRLASGAEDRTLRIWDAASGQQLACLLGHEGGVESVSWSPDGRHIASGGRDNTVRVWNAASDQRLAYLSGHRGAMRGVNWSPDGRHIASGARDNTVCVWDAASGQLLHRLQGHEGGVYSVGWSPDGRRLASGAGDRTLRVWDAASGRQLHCLRGHEGLVWSVVWSPDGRRLASWAEGNTVRLWDAESGDCLEVTHGREEVATSPGGSTHFPWRGLVRDMETVIESAATGQAVAWFPATPRHLSTHPAGRAWGGSINDYLCLFVLGGNPRDSA